MEQVATSSWATSMLARPQPGPLRVCAGDGGEARAQPSLPIPADCPYNLDRGERVRMNRRWAAIVAASYFRVASVVTCALTLMVSSVATQPQTNPTAATLADFDTRIKAYVALHRKLANETGEIDETKSPRQITDREVALGKLIRTARAQARRGDIFTPSVEALFKQLIREASARRSPRVRTDRKEDQDELADFTPTVNQAYPPDPAPRDVPRRPVARATEAPARARIPARPAQLDPARHRSQCDHRLHSCCYAIDCRATPDAILPAPPRYPVDRRRVRPGSRAPAQGEFGPVARHR